MVAQLLQLGEDKIVKKEESEKQQMESKISLFFQTELKELEILRKLSVRVETISQNDGGEALIRKKSISMKIRKLIRQSDDDESSVSSDENPRQAVR